MTPIRYAAMAAALVLILAQPALADSAPVERSVTVSASGNVKAEPDMAYVTVGITSQGATARAAVANNNTAMAKLIGGLKAAGIAAPDLQTTSFYLSQRYTQPAPNRPSVPDGYTLTNQVRVTVHDIKRVGEVLDTAFAMGANESNGISFDVSNAETLRDEARKQAMANARRRAELYAAAAGAQLGPVLEINENIGMRYMPQAPQAMMRAEAKVSASVESGTETLGADVQVTYALR